MTANEIENDPYKTINDYFEGILPRMGRKVSEYACLMNPGMMLPKMFYKDRTERSIINLILLSPASGGKTVMLEYYYKMALFPVKMQYITHAKAAKVIDETRFLTLIFNDMAKICSDVKLLKLIEGVSEEGCFEYDTMVGERSANNLTACFFGTGVPQDLTARVGSGLIFRAIPIVITHNLDNQKAIGKDIASNIGIKNEEDTTIDDIVDFYKKLQQVQDPDNNENPHVVNVFIDDDARKRIHESWANTLDTLGIDETSLWFREELDGFRFHQASAMLNYFNRDKEPHEEGVRLLPNKKDVDIAIKLMTYEILQKYQILQLMEIKKNLGKIKSLKL